MNHETETPRTDAVMASSNWPYHITSEMQKLERELTASKAEVARLQKELDATCNAEELRQERETRKRAEAEVERLTDRMKKAEDLIKGLHGGWKKARKAHLETCKNAQAEIDNRTRRPLPKQEEERLLKVMEYCRKWADEHLAGHGKETFYARLGLLVDFATDLYRDEIEQLKKNQK
jgi:predicted RNase H-like nuclease (RuvC/YqgF family)